VKRKTELFLSLINRATIPVATFLSLIIFARTLPADEFNGYLISMTVATWSIATAFQWQKNTVIRLFDPREKSTTKYFAVAFLTAAASTVVIFAYSYIDQRISSLVAVFVITTGLTYVLGGILRSSGRTFAFLTTETLFTLVKWTLGATAAYFFISTDAIFIGLAIGTSLACTIAFSIIIKDGYSLFQEKTSALEIRKILGFGFFLAINDFFGSGLMYVDRLWFSDATVSESYIIASNIGNQISSVIMGAFLMVVFPRISTQYKSGGAWEASFKKYLKLFPGFALTCCAASYFGAPYLIEFIKPSLYEIPHLAILVTVSQCCYYLLVFLSIPYLITMRPKTPTLIIALSFILFLILGQILIKVETQPQAIVLSKTIILLLSCVASWYLYSKRLPGKAAP